MQRLDAPALVAAINDAFGLRLVYRGPARGGNVGAGFVSDAAGRRFVLTWAPNAAVGRHQQIAGLLDGARARGIPAPRYERVLQVGTDVAILQELLRGRAPGRVTPELIEAMLAVNQRCRGALLGRDDVATPQLYLRASGPGFCLHEPLLAYSARTRRLLRRVQEIGAAAPNALAGYDLVHLDFQPANVLVDESGALTGIIDWDGAARGDADFDLVVLLFGLHASGDCAATITCLRERLHTHVPPDLLRAYWAHMGLRMVDWAIRHYGPRDVDTWLQLAESGLQN